VKWAETRYQEALAKSTADGYRIGVNHLQDWINDFCPNSGLSVENPSEETLVLWVLYESQFLKGTSLNSYLHGVRDFNLDLGYGNVLTTKFRLQKVMKMIRKEDGEEAGVRLGVTVPLLLELRLTLDLELHDDRLLWATWCLGVFCLMRIGEIVGGRRGRDLRFGSAGGRLWLSASKTDYLGKGVALHFYKNGTDACPWTAADMYVRSSATPLDPDGPLFVKEDGSLVTREWLISQLRAAFDTLGYDGSLWNGISFRRGGAQSLALAGVSDRIIQAMGRWRSWCFKLYIGTQHEELEHASRQMAIYQPSAVWDVTAFNLDALLGETLEGLRSSLCGW
jgi:hypothetical protein